MHIAEKQTAREGSDVPRMDACMRSQDMRVVFYCDGSVSIVADDILHHFLPGQRLPLGTLSHHPNTGCLVVFVVGDGEIVGPYSK